MDVFIGVCSMECNFSNHQVDITPLLTLLYITKGNINNMMSISSRTAEKMQGQRYGISWESVSLYLYWHTEVSGKHEITNALLMFLLSCYEQCTRHCFPAILVPLLNETFQEYFHTFPYIADKKKKTGLWKVPGLLSVVIFPSLFWCRIRSELAHQLLLFISS